ncbi:carbohydrate ABC transporter permease [Falsiroseomonas sp. HW251]|uniref:carbohydrate ABC transporter permease n=1 Tax=Falsiroseomonas sp. HW251 TaxID=3390998 RepID=UPI003D317667
MRSPARRAPRDADSLWRWATLSPALLLMAALGLLPVLNLFVLGFFDVRWTDGGSSWSFVGTRHYAALPGDPLFRASILNTTLFALGAVAGQMLLGFALALLCHKATRGRVFWRAVFVLPVLIPGIVIGAMWKLLLNPEFGAIAQVFEMVELEPVDWLGEASTALLAVIMVDIWHWTPFCFLLFLAGLESLPRDVYEAARVDGARGWQELRYITLPLMWPTIVVTFVFRLVLAFKVFDEVYLLTGGGPGTATEVVAFTIYQRFFTEDRAGYGSAMAVAVIFLIFLMLAAAAAARRRVQS